MTMFIVGVVAFAMMFIGLIWIIIFVLLIMSCSRLRTIRIMSMTGLILEYLGIIHIGDTAFRLAIL